MLVDADARAVNHDDVTIVSRRHSFQEPIPHTRLPPAHEAIVAGRGGAIPVWDVSPGRAGAEAPEDAVEHAPIIHPRHPSWLVGQKRLDHPPLAVAQFVTAHPILPMKGA